MTPTGPERRHKPFVPEGMQMTEFTLRALFIGLVMTIVLGAANAYLGLRAGQTIAATYPAAVIGMAVLRAFKGSILEENIARTAGSIGESVAAGAIFTVPAFVIAKVWPSFSPADAYWKSTVLMTTGGVLGVLFCSLVRRVLVEDPDLPFPESVAASEIHKAGQHGAQGAKYLFWNMGFGGLVYILSALGLFATDRNFAVAVGELGKSKLRLSTGGGQTLVVGGISTWSGPTISPAYFGVGYIIGPELASINFSGSVLAWGLLIPLLIYFLGPQLQTMLPPQSATDAEAWGGLATGVWRFIVRPIAVGGMLFGSIYTLFRMRKALTEGLSRAFAEFRGTVSQAQAARTERYMSSKVVIWLIFMVFLFMIGLYTYFSGHVTSGIVAAAVMLIVGFFFATVSGYLVGVIGSSNNPISGLTLSTIIVAALLMLALGVSGTGGVLAVLGVAAVVCVSSAVAGELLQDFKVGYILGGTPKSIQIVELIAVVAASLVMYFPLMVLDRGMGGFGSAKLPAPQAGLMAYLAQGIVGGEMAWPLVMVGVLMGFALVLVRVKSPMLVAIGMYLPLGTVFAIFVGGMMRWVTDSMSRQRGHNPAQRARVDNVGVLAASGMIAGEALMGLVTATFNFMEKPLPQLFSSPSYWVGIAVMALIAFVLVHYPLAGAGSPDEPAPPTAMM
jgi:putative OPT family oligopeptide transporter